MNPLSNRPISFKLTAIVLLTAGIVLGLNAIIYIISEVYNARSDLEERLTTLSTLLAANTTAALHFNDHEAAYELLATLNTQPEIAIASIHLPDGTLFTEYRSAGAHDLDTHQHEDGTGHMDELFSRPLEPGLSRHIWTDTHIHLVHPVYFNHSDLLGSVHIVGTTVELSQRLTRHLVTVLVLMLLSFLIVFLLSSRLQRIITRPMNSLMQTMDTVTRRSDFSIRARHDHDDELGILVRGFNKMLAQIQERDRKLQNYHQQLEELVKQRTSALRDALDRFSTVLNAIDAMIYVIDMETHEVLFLNDAAKARFGDVVGQTCWQVLQDDQESPCDFCSNSRLVDEHGRPSALHAWEYESRKQERWYAIRDRAIPWDRGRLVRLEIATNISDLKQVQIDLEQARDNAESANRAKSDFLSRMSHEIRTPMNGILGFTRLLQETPLDQTQSDYLHTIAASSNNLMAIINDILDFSKLESDKLVLEQIPFNLREVVDGVLVLLAPQAYEKRLELINSYNTDTPESYIGDPGRLRQVLLNLLGNAIKFTEQGEVAIEISSESTGIDHVELRISVSDTGIGIREEQQRHLFQAFTQADSSTTRRYGGSGLGLVISKRLVDLMGGEIEMQSEENHGTLFHIRLTLDRSNEALYEYPDFGARRILIYEKNRAYRSQLQQLLAHCNASTGYTEEPHDIARLLADEPFDLLLCGLDYSESEEGGFSQLLLQSDKPESVPVAVLINSTDLHLHQQLRSQGADLSLAKSEPATRLLHRLEQLICTRTTAVAETGSHQIKPDLSRLRILLVEDNRINRMLTSALLKECHAEVLESESATQAQALLGKRRFDLVLFSFPLSDRHGQGLLERLQRPDEHHPPPGFIHMKSELHEPGQPFQAPDGLLTMLKPCTAEKLYAAVSQWQESLQP